METVSSSTTTKVLPTSHFHSNHIIDDNECNVCTPSSSSSSTPSLKQCHFVGGPFMPSPSNTIWSTLVCDGANNDTLWYQPRVAVEIPSYEDNNNNGQLQQLANTATSDTPHHVSRKNKVLLMEEVSTSTQSRITDDVRSSITDCTTGRLVNNNDSTVRAMNFADIIDDDSGDDDDHMNNDVDYYWNSCDDILVDEVFRIIETMNSSVNESVEKPTNVREEKCLQYQLTPNFDNNSSDACFVEYKDNDIITSVRQNDFESFITPFEFIRAMPPPVHRSPRSQPLLPSLRGDGEQSRRPTLVLDLDETLVHCSVEPLIGDCDTTVQVEHFDTLITVYVCMRPYVADFLRAVSASFEVVVFTASQRDYADALLDFLDPSGQLIAHRLYREHCVEINGTFIKDLSELGRPLNNMIIIDNSPSAFAYHIYNGMPIESFFSDADDSELLILKEYLDNFLHKREKLPGIDLRHLVWTQFKDFWNSNGITPSRIPFVDVFPYSI